MNGHFAIADADWCVREREREKSSYAIPAAPPGAKEIDY